MGEFCGVVRRYDCYGLGMVVIVNSDYGKDRRSQRKCGRA